MGKCESKYSTWVSWFDSFTTTSVMTYFSSRCKIARSFSDSFCINTEEHERPGRQLVGMWHMLPSNLTDESFSTGVLSFSLSRKNGQWSVCLSRNPPLWRNVSSLLRVRSMSSLRYLVSMAGLLYVWAYQFVWAYHFHIIQPTATPNIYYICSPIAAVP